MCSRFAQENRRARRQQAAQRADAVVAQVLGRRGAFVRLGNGLSMGLSLIDIIGTMRVMVRVGVRCMTVVPLVRKRICALVSPHGLQGEEHTQQEEQETAPHGQARIFAQPRALAPFPCPDARLGEPVQTGGTAMPASPAFKERENKVSNSAHYGAVIQLAAKHAGKVSNLLRKIATAADESHGNVSNPVARQALLGHVAWSSDDLAKCSSLLGSRCCLKACTGFQRLVVFGCDHVNICP